MAFLSACFVQPTPTSERSDRPAAILRPLAEPIEAVRVALRSRGSVMIMPGGRRLSSRGDASQRLFVFARHGESTANSSGLVSSNPARSVELTFRGVKQARELGTQIAGLHIDLAVVTRFRRTRETVELALGGRRVPILTEPRFDEIQAGDFDGSPLQDYWSWKQRHTADDRLPNGESEDEARIRYAAGLRELLSRTERVTLIVLHGLALRWIADAAADSPSGPDSSFANGAPYMFDRDALQRSAERLEASAHAEVSDGS